MYMIPKLKKVHISVEGRDNDEKKCQPTILKRKEIGDVNKNEKKETEGLGNKRRRGNNDGNLAIMGYILPSDLIENKETEGLGNERKKVNDDGNSKIMGYILPTERQLKFQQGFPTPKVSHLSNDKQQLTAEQKDNREKNAKKWTNMKGVKNSCDQNQTITIKQQLTTEQKDNREKIAKKWTNMKALKMTIDADTNLKKQVYLAHGEKEMKAFYSFGLKGNQFIKISERVFLGDTFYEKYKSTISQVVQGQLLSTKSIVEVKIKELGNGILKKKQNLEYLLKQINSLSRLTEEEFADSFEKHLFNFEFLKFAKEYYPSTAELRTETKDDSSKPSEERSILLSGHSYVSKETVNIQFLNIKKAKQRRYLISPYKTNSDDPNLSSAFNCNKFSYIILCSTQKEQKSRHLEFKWFMHHSNLRNYLGVPYIGLVPLDEEIWKNVSITFHRTFTGTVTSCTLKFILGPDSLKIKSIDVEIPTTVFEMQKLVKNKMNFVLLNDMIDPIDLAYRSDTVFNRGFCESFFLLPNCPDNYIFHVGKNGRWPGTNHQTNIENLGKELVGGVLDDCPSTQLLGYILPTKKQQQSSKTTVIKTMTKPVNYTAKKYITVRNGDISTFVQVEDRHVTLPDDNNPPKQSLILPNIPQCQSKATEENRLKYLKCPIPNCKDSHGSIKHEAENILNVLTETHFKDYIDYILSIEQKQITDKRHCPFQPCGFVALSRIDLIKHYGVIHKYSNSILKVSAKYDSQSCHKLSFYPQLRQEINSEPKETAKTKLCQVCELKCDERYEIMHRAFCHHVDQLEKMIVLKQNKLNQNSKQCPWPNCQYLINSNIIGYETLETLPSDGVLLINHYITHDQGAALDQISNLDMEVQDEILLKSNILKEEDEIEVDQNEDIDNAKQEVLFINTHDVKQESLEVDINTEIATKDSLKVEIKTEIEDEVNVPSDVVFEYEDIIKQELLEIEIENEIDNASCSSSLVHASTPENTDTKIDVHQLLTQFVDQIQSNTYIERTTMVTQKKMRQNIFEQLILFLAQKCESSETAFQVLTYLEEENICIVNTSEINFKQFNPRVTKPIASTTLYRDFKNIFWIVLEYKKYCKSINQSVTSCSSLNIIIWMNLIMKTYQIYPKKMILALQLVSSLHEGVPHENQSFLSFPPGCSASLFLLISKQWPLSSKSCKTTHRPLIHDDNVHKFLYHIASNSSLSHCFKPHHTNTIPDQVKSSDEGNKSAQQPSVAMIRKIHKYKKGSNFQIPKNTEQINNGFTQIDPDVLEEMEKKTQKMLDAYELFN